MSDPRDIDEDAILKGLSAEELDQLEYELQEMDPEVKQAWGSKGHPPEKKTQFHVLLCDVTKERGTAALLDLAAVCFAPRSASVSAGGCKQGPKSACFEISHPPRMQCCRLACGSVTRPRRVQLGHLTAMP